MISRVGDHRRGRARTVVGGPCGSISTTAGWGGHLPGPSAGLTPAQRPGTAPSRPRSVQPRAAPMSPVWTEAATMTIAAGANQLQLPIGRPTRPAIIRQKYMFALLSLCRADKGTVRLGSRSLLSVDQTGTVATGVAPPWNAPQLSASSARSWLTRAGETPTRRATRPGSCPSVSSSATRRFFSGRPASHAEKSTLKAASSAGPTRWSATSQSLHVPASRPGQLLDGATRRPRSRGRAGPAEDVHGAAAAGGVADSRPFGRSGPRCWRSR